MSVGYGRKTDNVKITLNDLNIEIATDNHATCSHCPDFIFHPIFFHIFRYAEKMARVIGLGLRFYFSYSSVTRIQF